MSLGGVAAGRGREGQEVVRGARWLLRPGFVVWPRIIGEVAQLLPRQKTLFSFALENKEETAYLGCCHRCTRRSGSRMRAYVLASAVRLGVHRNVVTTA